jgi:hypothetical protein
MTEKAEQIENGALKMMVSTKSRQVLKKSKRKKMSIVKLDETTQNNRRDGWTV